MKAARFLYALALLSMPFSYALKYMLQLRNIVWIPPCVVFGFLCFVLLKLPVRDKRSLWVVLYAFLAASIGCLYISVSPERVKPSLYTAYLESIRLCLEMIWYWVSIEFIYKARGFVLRWVIISVIAQLLVAIYIFLAFFDVVPAPDFITLYTRYFAMAQSVTLGGVSIPRMGGTFVEGPPFGLFMFSCFVIFMACLAQSTGAKGQSDIDRKWVKWGAGFGLIGAIGSLSDQVLLALLAFGLCWYLSVHRRTAQATGLAQAARIVIISSVFIGVATYVIPKVTVKAKQAAATSRDELGTMGDAGAERVYHLRYGLQVLGENPLAIVTGIGPGRYGDYVVRTGQYKADTPIQNMPLAWLVEYGLLGTILILYWLGNIAKKTTRIYRFMGIGICVGLFFANITQGGWLAESWFFALAFFYCAGGKGMPTLALFA